MNYYPGERAKGTGKIASKSGYARKQVPFVQPSFAFWVRPHVKILVGRKYTEKTKKTSAGRPAAELAPVTGTRFLTDPGKSFIDTYPGVDREFGFDHACEVDIMVAAELMRILTEQRHYFYRKFHQSAGKNIVI